MSRVMRIKHSYFDYGGEIEVWYTLLNNNPARLVIRRNGNQYELYAHFYRSPEPDAGETIVRGSLEKVIQAVNALMWKEFGSSWEGDIVVPEDSNIPRPGRNRECRA